MIKRFANKQMFKEVHRDNMFSPSAKDERVTYVTFLPNPDEIYLTTEIKQYVKLFWKIGTQITTEKTMLAVPSSLMELLHEIKREGKVEKDYLETYREKALNKYEVRAEEAIFTIMGDKDLTTTHKNDLKAQIELDVEGMTLSLRDLDKVEETHLKPFLKDATYIGKTPNSMVGNSYFFARVNEDSIVIIEVSGIKLGMNEKAEFFIVGVNTFSYKFEAIQNAMELLDKELLNIIKKEAK